MRYQKVEVNTWNDEKFTKLSQDAKMLFLYFLTCPHSNSIGAYVAKKGYISEDLNWDTKKIKKTLPELLRNGLIKYDESLSVVVIVNYLKHNTIENPNQAKNAVKNFQSLPKTEILQDVGNCLETVSEHFKISFETPTIYASVSVTDSVTEEVRKETPLKNIIPPKLEDVIAYCKDRNNGVNPQKWFDHYTSNGWKVGKTRMVDWQATVRTWEDGTPKEQAPKKKYTKYIEYKQGESPPTIDKQGRGEVDSIVEGLAKTMEVKG